MIDLTFRCFSRARWITVATAKGVYDASGNVTSGFAVDEIGACVTTKAILDAQGAIVTPAVMDTWFLVNLRIFSAAVSAADLDALYAGEVEDGFMFTKSKLAAFIRNQATIQSFTINGVAIKAYEFGLTTNRIQLLDPRQYASVKTREWLGGMNFQLGKL